MRERRFYYVYIVSNASRSSLYTGISSSLFRRVDEHAAGEHEGFSAQCRTMRLVYAEQYHEVANALAREEQIKCWSRVKKAGLIEAVNPKWDDMRHHGELRFGQVWVKRVKWKQSDLLRAGEDGKSKSNPKSNT